MSRPRIRMALQIPNFTYPAVGPEALFERVAQTARAAESAGFDTVLVMDHFYQLPVLGPPEHEMLEAYTLLGALAARTERVRLGTLVSGNTYRNPRSRRSAGAWTCSRKRCRSSAPCCAANGRASRAPTTAPRMP